MNSKVKKIIAREILLVFGLILFIPIFFGGFYLKNSFYVLQSNSLKDDMNTIAKEIEIFPQIINASDF